MKEAKPKHGFHFASDGIHEAAYIEAETIEEAQKLYHKSKVPLGAVSTVASEQPEESTVE